MTREAARSPGVARPPLFSRAFVLLWIAAFGFFTAGNTVLPVSSRFAAGPLGADSAGVGIAIGVFSVAALALRPVVGWASDRFGRRPLLILGGSLTVAALVLHLFVTTLPMFIVARAIFGVGDAFFFVSAVAAISDMAPPERRGEAINVGSLAVYLGLAFGPFLGETILAARDYNSVWIAAGVMAAATTVISLFVPETAPVALRPKDPDGKPQRSPLIHPAGLLPGSLLLAGTWGMAGFLAFVPLYLGTVGMGAAGPVLAEYALIVVSLRIIFVRLPDQIGAVPLSAFALIGSAVGMTILGIVRDPVGVYLGTAVFASGIAFLFPALLAVAVSRVDENERGSVVGTTTAFVDLSFGISPAVLGFLAGSIGLGGAWIVSAVIAALGACVLAVRRDSLVHRPEPA